MSTTTSRNPSPATAPTPATPTDAAGPRPADPIGAALSHLDATQDSTGSWRGDYGGPMFLLPLFVAVARTVGHPLSSEERAGMGRYLRAHQRDDGGWGLHVEGHSHVFTTALSYVALRFLGVGADDPAAARALAFLNAQGGPRASASWGKFALAVLGLYDWEGLHPVPPELWLLPDSLPMHPSRLWCHARMVYLPMSWLYGRRATAPADALVEALRRELYPGEPFERIDWRAARDTCSPTDRYVPLSPLLQAVNHTLGAYERVRSRALRDRALAHVLDHLRAEDAATDYICIGPVNKLLQHARVALRRAGRPGSAPPSRAPARLPLARARRPQDAGLQLLRAVGHGVRRASRARDGPRRRVRAPAAPSARLHRVEPGARGRARPRALVPPPLARRLALLDACARLADQRLHR